MISAYLTYHLAYATPFIFQEMEIGNNMKVLIVIKYLGSTIILLILLGGLIELLDVFIPLMI